MSRPTRTATIALIAALVLAAPATAGARALLLSGSTSIFPLMTQLAAAYHKATHQPTPKVGQGTSDAGINEVAAGKVDIGDVSRDPIIGVDPVEDRRALALELGAATVLSEIREVRSHVAPTPAVIECSGYAPLLHAAADLVAPGGRLVLVGVPFGETTVIPLMWVTREIEIIGSIASNAADFAASLGMLAADPGIARIATRRVALAQVPEVFEELITPSSGGKVIVDPRL